MLFKKTNQTNIYAHAVKNNLSMGTLVGAGNKRVFSQV